MTQLRMTYGQAFEVLLKHSRDGNRKLREVADWVLATGALPDHDDDGSRHAAPG